MNEFEIEIVINGQLRWGMKVKPGQAVQLPVEMMAEFSKRPQMAQLFINSRPVPDSEIAFRVEHARMFLSQAKSELDRLP